MGKKLGERVTMSKTPDPSLGVHRVVSTRAGWRLFRCDECGEQWQTTSRDIYSPSGEDCVCCGAWVHPFSRSQDPPVATDDKGNVIEHECIVVFHGNPQRCRKCETTQADLVAGVCRNCLDRCFTDTNIETDLN